MHVDLKFCDNKADELIFVIFCLNLGFSECWYNRSEFRHLHN